MAAPIVTVALDPTVVAPGETSRAVVDAIDPDSKTGRIAFPVRDKANNTATAIASLRVQDDLTFGDPEDLDGVGWIFTRGAGLGEFFIQAPVDTP